MDRAAWKITSDETCAELIEILELSDEECQSLAALKPEAEKIALSMSEDFHARLLKFDNTKEYFEGIDVKVIDRALADWFIDLFTGVYDETYAKKRIKIGEVHFKIGLPVRYPLAMLDIVQEHSQKLLDASADPVVANRAFRKILSLDISVFNQAYENEQLKNLAEMVGGTRLARRLLTGG
ncbi:protoglobin domain-containing protein [Cerasicoccus maritimus]|uniref:protoglobin domain-containing protein n=1 Tax=Cerasicoccus maritimus TaxID=490089 RepID=UPI0028527FF8|nr:protoglobin domain-containing protein [Cerasicoccus maritimus]